MILTAAIALMLQANPIEPMSVTPETIRDRASRTGSTLEPAETTTELTRLGRCLRASPLDAKAAESAARSWMAEVSGADLAPASHCLGMALSEQARWTEAANAFGAARKALAQDADTDDTAYAARLGTLAGSAMLAADDAQGALDAFAAARNDAVTAGEAALAASIAVDLASAQGVLGDLNSAAGTLDQARDGDPTNPAAWLLSAQVARQSGDLERAQGFIQQAAGLTAANRALGASVGLEAGIIAALAGRYDAALQSWRSVVDLAPDSDEASRAKSLIAQVDALQEPASE